jgi:hypothetical protein
VSLTIISLNIIKRVSEKTLKMLRLRVFGPPRFAPYLVVIAGVQAKPEGR